MFGEQRRLQMPLLKKGSIGAEVKGVQLRLNTRLKPSPKLNADGNFGLKTEAAVIRFQRENSLATDGIVGNKTSSLLAAQPKIAAPPNLSKFVSELGTLQDFVQHVAMLEASQKSTSTLMTGLIDSFGTSGRKRYLLVKGDKVGVIDFRHFFAAATESYNSGISSAKLGVRLGGNEGQTVLLGVGYEIGQCVSEAIARKINSCFSSEDLGSNRLGAGFGEYVKVREAGASKQKVSQLLQEYMSKFQPVEPSKINSIKTPSRWDIAIETLTAIAAGIGDFIVP
jgi:hypothetical protein